MAPGHSVVYLLNAYRKAAGPGNRWRSAMVFYKEANLETLNTSQAPPSAAEDFAWLSDDGYIEWEGWEHDGRFNSPSEERMRFLIFPRKNKGPANELAENELAGYAMGAKGDPKKSLAVPIYRADDYAGKNVIFSDSQFDYIRVYYCTKAEPPTNTLRERNAAKAQSDKNKSTRGTSSLGGVLSRRVERKISQPPIGNLETQENGPADHQEDTHVDGQGDAGGDAPKVAVDEASKDVDKTGEDLANPASDEQTHEEDAKEDDGGTLFT